MILKPMAPSGLGTAFLEPHMEHRGNLAVSVLSRARRVLLEGNRAVGDELRVLGWECFINGDKQG